VVQPCFACFVPGSAVRKRQADGPGPRRYTGLRVSGFRVSTRTNTRLEDVWFVVHSCFVFFVSGSAVRELVADGSGSRSFHRAKGWGVRG